MVVVGGWRVVVGVVRAGEVMPVVVVVAVVESRNGRVG